MSAFKQALRHSSQPQLHKEPGLKAQGSSETQGVGQKLLKWEKCQQLQATVCVVED